MWSSRLYTYGDLFGMECCWYSNVMCTSFSCCVMLGYLFICYIFYLFQSVEYSLRRNIIHTASTCPDSMLIWCGRFVRCFFYMITSPINKYSSTLYVTLSLTLVSSSSIRPVIINNPSWKLFTLSEALSSSDLINPAYVSLSSLLHFLLFDNFMNMEVS